MTIGKWILKGLVLSLWSLLVGCSSDESQSGGAARTYEDDRREIEGTLDETATRWRYGDKAILYEQEFEFVRIEYTYDEYLEIDRIKRMESDTVRAFRVKDVKFFDRDSAQVSVDVVFVGPTKDTTRLPQEWTMYYHKGRWIRPTMSTPAGQAEFEERKRKADSAAAAEEDEEW